MRSKIETRIKQLSIIRSGIITGFHCNWKEIKSIDEQLKFLRAQLADINSIKRGGLMWLVKNVL